MPSKDTNYKKIQAKLNKIQGLSNDDPDTPDLMIQYLEEVLEALKNLKSKQQTADVLKRIQTNGHGGGNFRRLIAEELASIEEDRNE